MSNEQTTVQLRAQSADNSHITGFPMRLSDTMDVFDLSPAVLAVLLAAVAVVRT